MVVGAGGFSVVGAGGWFGAGAFCFCTGVVMRDYIKRKKERKEGRIGTSGKVPAASILLRSAGRGPEQAAHRSGEL